MTTLQDFMISRVRSRVLELFFSNVEEMFYVREITRRTKEEINAVRRELERLLGCGILKSEERGNRLYYSLNKRYTFFQELENMVAKSTGLGLKIRKLQRKLGELSFVMFSGRFVRKMQVRQGDVDMLVVGTVVLPELELLVKETEKALEREINYTVLSDEEFEFRKTRRDPFVMDALYGTRIMIIGSEDEFVERKTPGL
ncbi:MAG: winged helix-turn-helix domain-containing protein [bacterium]|nr:winged helix-turn-helix domain-containing protein [bacterium]